MDYNPGIHNHNHDLTFNRIYGRRKRDGVGENDRHVPFKGQVPIVRDGNLEYGNESVEHFGTEVKASECTLIIHEVVVHSEKVKL